MRKILVFEQSWMFSALRLIIETFNPPPKSAEIPSSLTRVDLWERLTVLKRPHQVIWLTNILNRPLIVIPQMCNGWAGRGNSLDKCLLWEKESPSSKSFFFIWYDSCHRERKEVFIRAISGRGFGHLMSDLTGAENQSRLFAPRRTLGRCLQPALVVTSHAR